MLHLESALSSDFCATNFRHANSKVGVRTRAHRSRMESDRRRSVTVSGSTPLGSTCLREGPPQARRFLGLSIEASHQHGRGPADAMAGERVTGVLSLRDEAYRVASIQGLHPTNSPMPGSGRAGGDSGRRQGWIGMLAARQCRVEGVDEPASGTARRIGPGRSDEVSDRVSHALATSVMKIAHHCRSEP